MRKALRWLLVARRAHRHGEHGGGGDRRSAGSRIRHQEQYQHASSDIKDRLLAIPGMSLIEEKPYTGYRYFVLNYTQPVDHRHPSKGTFQQRITVLHKDISRPTVFFTSGYNVSHQPRAAVSRRGSSTATRSRWSTASSPRPGPTRPTGPSWTSGRPPATSTASSRR